MRFHYILNRPSYMECADESPRNVSHTSETTLQYCYSVNVKLAPPGGMR